MTDRAHQRGFWEAKFLVHREYEQRHRIAANEAREHLRVSYPESHLVSGGKDGTKGA